METLRSPKGFGEMIHSPAKRRMGNAQGKCRGAKTSQRGLGEVSGIDRAMHHGIGETCTDSNKGGNDPSVGKVMSESSPGDSQQRKRGKSAGCRRQQEVAGVGIAELTLNHEEQTCEA